MDAIGDCFCLDGRFGSRDGVLDARGRDAVLEQFRGRFPALGPSNLLTPDRVVGFEGCDADHARGTVNSNAEAVRHGVPMLFALRYEDRYRPDADGRWRFADRLMSFYYYLKIEQYPPRLADALRMRACDEPAPADLPENRPTWRE